jgi:hypothetical protein
MGAWLGAIPIPLDWDRPWQVRTFLILFMFKYMLCNFILKMNVLSSIHFIKGMANTVHLRSSLWVHGWYYWLIYLCAFV